MAWCGVVWCGGGGVYVCVGISVQLFWLQKAEPCLLERRYSLTTLTHSLTHLLLSEAFEPAFDVDVDDNLVARAGTSAVGLQHCGVIFCNGCELCRTLSAHKQLERVREISLFRTNICLLYTSPSPRDQRGSRMPSSA